MEVQSFFSTFAFLRQKLLPFNPDFLILIKMILISTFPWKKIVKPKSSYFDFPTYKKI